MINFGLLASVVFTTDRLQLSNARVYIERLPQNREQLIETAVALLTPQVTETLPHNFQGVDDIQSANVWLEQMLATSELVLVELPASGEIIGFIFLAKMDEQNAHSTVHLGYLLGEKYWRKGYANEALEGLLQWSRSYLFDTLFIAGVDNHNHSSVKLLDNHGFSKRSVQPVIDVTFFQLSI